MSITKTWPEFTSRFDEQGVQTEVSTEVSTNSDNDLLVLSQRRVGELGGCSHDVVTLNQGNVWELLPMLLELARDKLGLNKLYALVAEALGPQFVSAMEAGTQALLASKHTAEPAEEAKAFSTVGSMTGRTASSEPPKAEFLPVKRIFNKIPPPSMICEVDYASFESKANAAGSLLSATAMSSLNQVRGNLDWLAVVAQEKRAELDLSDTFTKQQHDQWRAMLDRMSLILSSFSVFAVFARAKHIIQHEHSEPTLDTTPVGEAPEAVGEATDEAAERTLCERRWHGMPTTTKMGLLLSRRINVVYSTWSWKKLPQDIRTTLERAMSFTSDVEGLKKDLKQLVDDGKLVAAEVASTDPDTNRVVVNVQPVAPIDNLYVEFNVPQTDQLLASRDLLAGATERICNELGVPASLFKDSVRLDDDARLGYDIGNMPFNMRNVRPSGEPLSSGHGSFIENTEFGTVPGRNGEAQPLLDLKDYSTPVEHYAVPDLPKPETVNDGDGQQRQPGEAAEEAQGS